MLLRNLLLTNVEQDILMDEMNELENVLVEKILSNDYLIIENVLYGIPNKFERIVSKLGLLRFI